MSGHISLPTPGEPTDIKAMQRRLLELEQRLAEQQQAQYDQRRQPAQARVHAAVLEITDPQDLNKITGRQTARPVPRTARALYVRPRQ